MRSAVILGCAVALWAGATREPISRAQLAVPAQRQATLVAVLPVHGEIDEVTARSLERRVEQAVQDGATAIVIELNTPGGDAYGTLQICHLIKTQFPANTVAWVHPNAYSAGAIIALACREIIMSEGAAMGDAAPIQGVPGVGLTPLPATERAKIEAPIISEVADSARRRGYDEGLVRSFVRLGSELWLLRKKDSTQRAIVDRDEYHAIFGEDPPTQATNRVPAWADLADGAIEPIAPLFTGSRSRDVLESPEGMPTPRVRLAAQERDAWQLVGQVAFADQLLVVRTDEAEALSLCRGTVNDDRELKAWMGASSVVRYSETWSEHAVRFLTSWPVRIVLVIVLIVGFALEAMIPGGFLFGAAATVALLLLIGAPALVGMAQWWELVAVLVGLALVALDIVVIPVGGWIAVLGGAMVLAGLVSSFVTRDISSVEGQRQLLVGIGTTLAGLFGSAAAIWALWRYIPESKFARRATLQEAATTRAGPALLAAEGVPDSPGVGTVLSAATDLRPSGKVLWQRRPIDARTTGDYVNAGARVRLVRCLAGEWEVEAVPDADHTTPWTPQEHTG